MNVGLCNGRDSEPSHLGDGGGGGGGLSWCFVFVFVWFLRQCYLITKRGTVLITAIH